MRIHLISMLEVCTGRSFQARARPALLNLGPIWLEEKKISARAEIKEIREIKVSAQAQPSPA